MEPRADLEQRADVALDPRLPGRRRRDPREDLEQRRLPGPVVAHDPDGASELDLEVDVAERPDLLAVAPAGGASALAEDVALAQAARLDREVR